MKCRNRWCTLDATDGLKSCSACRERVRAYSRRDEVRATRLRKMKEEQRELYEHGICRCCRAAATWFESPRCRSCLDKAAEARRLLRASRTAAIRDRKVCSCCTVHPPRRGGKLCSKCIKQQRTWHRAQHHEVPTRCLIAEALADGPRALAEIAESIDMTPRNTLRNLQRMEAEGVLSRVIEDSDGFGRALYILRKLEAAYG